MTELLVFYGSEFALELGVDLRRYRKSLPIIDLQRNIQVHELEENANIPTSPDEEEGSNNFTSMLVGNTSGHTAVIGNDKEEEDFVCENKIQDTEQSNNNETTNVVDQNIFIFDERGRSCNEKASLIYDTSVHKMNEITKPPTTSNVIMNYLCEICNSKFISKSELINHHIEEHDSKIKYKACDQCNYKTSSTYNLNRHMIIHTSHTSENPHKCTVCNSNLNRIDELKRHLKTHTGIKPHKCTICDSKFHRRDQLKNHLRTHTVEKPYQCTICNSKFSHYYSLKSHLRIHTAEKPYNCTVCNSKFTARHSLKTHTRTHNGESYQLKRLLKSHTGEKPYQCTVCDSKFSVRSRLKIHLRIHTGEKPYQCTVCDSKFAARGYLKRHLRTHTDEKPYQCTVCDSKFRDGYKLKIHFRTHTGEKPYQCTVCDSKFRDGSKLKIHLRTHTGDKPY